ncbi:MAG: CAP domain-containing protein, partial [Planctomycetota bacterium]
MTALFCLALLSCGPSAPAADVPFPKLERKMLELVNKDRRDHEKEPLEPDTRLAEVARGHSRDMMRHNFFGHQSPNTGTLSDRLRTAKIRVRIAGENVAKSRAIEQAEKNLMASPRHRASILHDKYSHCGIGIVQDKTGHYWITQVFATPAPDVDLDKAGAALLKDLNEARVGRGKLPCRGNRVLDRIAQGHADAIARAGRYVPIDLQAKAKAAGLSFRRLSMARLMTWNPQDLAAAKLLLRAPVCHV